MLSLAVHMGMMAAPVANRSISTNRSTWSDDVQDAAYHVHFCVEPRECDEWCVVSDSHLGHQSPCTL
eukprot:SAG31_NODE_84_length_27014_cov_3.743006_19_plen_67_part_00